MAPRFSSNRFFRCHGRDFECDNSCLSHGNCTSVPTTAPIEPSNSSSTVIVVLTSTSTVTDPSPPNYAVTITTKVPSTSVPIANGSAILSNGAIVGISVGGSAFLIFVFALGFLLWRYRQRKKVQGMKYTPWSRLNSDGASSDSHIAGTTRSRPSNALSVLEIPIPTHHLFDSPVSIRSQSNSFRTSQTIDGRALLKSLVPHDHPVPQLPTQQHYSSAYFEDVIPSPRAHQPFTSSPSRNMPVLHVTGSSNSSPSVYDSDPAQDVDELSRKAVNPHMGFVAPGPGISSIPVSLQPRLGISKNPTQIIRSSSHLLEVLLPPPPPVLTRSRSREARAIAELIRAIDSPPFSNDDINNKRVSTLSSSGHTSASARSETDGSIGIAVTTPFTSSSLYASGNISSRSSMTNTLLQRLTADFPLPPSNTIPPSNFDPS